MKNFDIVALGEILIDFTPYGTAEDGCMLFGRNPGGAPANLLATVAKYGGKTAFIGRVGADMFGEFLRETLKTNGIDDRALKTDEAHDTTLAFVSLDADGDRRFAFYRRFGADRFLSPEDVPTDLLADARIFHFGSISMTDDPALSATLFALARARENGCVISYDPNYRPMLWPSEERAATVIRTVLDRVDIAKFSREEAEMIGLSGNVEELAAALTDLGPSVALVTDGAGDLGYATSAGAHGKIPARRVKPTDTTGAGDIFYGTCLFELLRAGFGYADGDLQVPSAETLRHAATRAVAAAGISITRKGAIPSIPTYSEIPENEI